MVIEHLIEFLFPKCSLCDREGEWVMADELDALRGAPHFYDTSALRRLGMQSLDGAFAALGTYSNAPTLQRALWNLKYRRLPGISEELGSLFAEAVVASGFLQAGGMLCPVPLHWTRLFSRGWNQSVLLGQAIAREAHVPLIPLLVRAHATGSQAHRSRIERLGSLNGAFRMRRGAKVPAIVYLIDDVFTTGATLEECAAVLHSAGVRSVYALVLAHG